MFKLWKSLSRVWLFATPGLYSPWNFPGQNTGEGSLSLVQMISPTQGSNRGLPHCRWILYQLSLKRSPRILEWVAYPFSIRSSRPRNQIWVFCIAGKIFTNWAMREALCLNYKVLINYVTFTNYNSSTSDSYFGLVNIHSNSCLMYRGRKFKRLHFLDSLQLFFFFSLLNIFSRSQLLVSNFLILVSS